MNFVAPAIDHNQFAAEILRGNANVNLTQMAKPFGKRVKDWLRTDEAMDYLNAVAKKPVGQKCLTADNQQLANYNSVELKSVTADLVEVRQGGTPDKQGTWCTDYRIAMRFAQWLSPDFAVAVDDVLVRLIFGEAAIAERLNGIEPLIYEGKAWYNYRAVLRSFGFSGRASAGKRKARHPQFFQVIYGRNFITAEYFSLLKAYYSYRQLSINFNNQKGGASC